MKSNNKSYPPTIAQLLDFLVSGFSVVVFDDAIISQPYYKIIKVVLIAYFSVNP